MKKNRTYGLLYEFGLYKMIKIMRFTIFILLLSLTQAFAVNSYSQQTKLSLDMRNARIEEVIDQIEKNTEFFFMYNKNMIDVDRKVDVIADDKNVSEILDKLFKGTDVSYSIKDRQIMLINNRLNGEGKEMNQQQKSVKGKVTDSSGAPLPGVTVFVKGTSIGSITDINGSYSLSNIPENATLQFSFIGMKSQEIAIAGKTEINVTLTEESFGIDEVVAIGYGTQRKATVTGSIVTTKGDDIKATPTSSITNTLVGRLPGLVSKNTSGEPGYDDANLLIRAKNTFGDNSPLVVVDGVADRAGGFARIDANDIESITVLKDASAAIYGSRAANGVILVTTKRGKEGKTSVSYTFDYGLRTPTMFPKMTDAADYATALNEITRLIDKNPVPMYTDAEIQKFRDGSDPMNYPNIDPIKEAFNKYSAQKRHNVSVSGGTQTVRYFTSLGYQYEDNNYKESVSNYKQYNLRSNLDIQATKDLKLFVNISLRQQDRQSPGNTRGFGSGEIWRNIIQGDPRKIITYPNGLRAEVTSGGYNPLTAVDGSTGYVQNNSTYINGDLGFNWNFDFITKGLGLDGGLYFDKDNGFYKSFLKRYTLYSLNNTTGNYDPHQYGPTNASLSENMNHRVGVTSNLKLRYQRTFNDVHNVSAFVAYEQYEQKYNYLSAGRNDFVSTALDQVFAGDRKTMSNDGYATESARQNYFGRVDYAYAQKYLFQFNWRYDGSENFPKDNRFGFFPGASVGWIASEESFWKDNLPVVNYFKLRGSYGKMGNDKIRYNNADQHYTYLTNYTFDWNATLGGDNPAAYTGVRQVQTGNPNVTWEVATTYNLGFDAKFLNSAFNLEFDIFKQKRDHILDQSTAVVPLYAALELPAENVGSAESQGFEIALGYSKKINKIEFNVGGNFSYAKSKIVNFNEPDATPEWQKKTGKPIGADWLMYEAIGIYRTQADLDNPKYPRLGNAELGDLIFNDVSGDGILDGNDQVRLDKTDTPEIIFGINMGAKYKQFELTMLWQGAGNVWIYDFFEGGGGGIGTYTQDYFDNRWTPENPTASGPRIYDRDKTSTSKPNTFFLHDATYLRLKNLELAYNIPQQLLAKAKINNLRLFVSGYNLLTFSGLKDADPEGTASDQGYFGWSNIQTKVYNFGLNLTF
ncbi:MAG TPA: TonB-dependent receptor [Prolixibacteraceae bacterium]|nr:TonB-dependent receptor [Prolixibacteraceae bacterium]